MRNANACALLECKCNVRQVAKCQTGASSWIESIYLKFICRQVKNKSRKAVRLLVTKKRNGYLFFFFFFPKLIIYSPRTLTVAHNCCHIIHTYISACLAACRRRVTDLFIRTYVYLSVHVRTHKKRLIAQPSITYPPTYLPTCHTHYQPRRAQLVLLSSLSRRHITHPSIYPSTVRRLRLRCQRSIKSQIKSNQSNQKQIIPSPALAPALALGPCCFPPVTCFLPPRRVCHPSIHPQCVCAVTVGCRVIRSASTSAPCCASLSACPGSPRLASPRLGPALSPLSSVLCVLRPPSSSSSSSSYFFSLPLFSFLSFPLLSVPFLPRFRHPNLPTCLPSLVFMRFAQSLRSCPPQQQQPFYLFFPFSSSSSSCPVVPPPLLLLPPPPPLLPQCPCPLLSPPPPPPPPPPTPPQRHHHRHQLSSTPNTPAPPLITAAALTPLQHQHQCQQHAASNVNETSTNTTNVTTIPFSHGAATPC